MKGDVHLSCEIYRADGMRVSKLAGGVATRYRHDGQMGMEDAETQGANTTVTRYGLGARGVDMIERTASNGAVTTGFPSTTRTGTTWRPSPARARGTR